MVDIICKSRRDCGEAKLHLYSCQDSKLMRTGGEPSMEDWILKIRETNKSTCLPKDCEGSVLTEMHVCLNTHKHT